MIVDATITTSEVRKVEVNFNTVLKQRQREWIDSLGFKLPNGDCGNIHIMNGKWCYWEEHRHGSDSLGVLRDATESELRTEQAFDKLLALKFK